MTQAQKAAVAERPVHETPVAAAFRSPIDAPLRAAMLVPPVPGPCRPRLALAQRSSPKRLASQPEQQEEQA
jgi:hypothetical protein